MRLALAFRTFVILGIGLTMAGAGMHLLERPFPSVAVATVEASAAETTAAIPQRPDGPAVTGSQPIVSPLSPGASESLLRAAVAPPTPVEEVEPARAPLRPSSNPEPAIAPVDQVASLPSAVRVPVAGLYSDEKAAALIAMMNQARTDSDLPLMSTDTLLEVVAGVRAEDLAQRDYFDHYAPDGSSAFSELSARGVRYGLAGENLARNNYPDDESLKVAFDALMASEGHRANILEPRFDRVGVAALLDGELWIYVTVFMD